MKDLKELKQIALDLVDGKIFSDRHCRSPEEIRSSFMVLSFLDEKSRKEMEDFQPEMFYEYLDKAGPRAINGNPMFTSIKMLSKEECKIFNPLVQELLDQRKKFLDT